ncbi:MAG TPA: hypothetical protein VIJ75_06000 [Hanamia sp.]
MKNDKKLFESLRAKDLIGKDLYKIVTDDDYEGSTLGIIAGAALHASVEAFERAKETNLPLVMKENNQLIEIGPDGTRKVIKSFLKNKNNISEKNIVP